MATTQSTEVPESSREREQLPTPPPEREETIERSPGSTVTQGTPIPTAQESNSASGQENATSETPVANSSTVSEATASPKTSKAESEEKSDSVTEDVKSDTSKVAKDSKDSKDDKAKTGDKSDDKSSDKSDDKDKKDDAKKEEEKKKALPRGMKADVKDLWAKTDAQCKCCTTWVEENPDSSKNVEESDECLQHAIVVRRKRKHEGNRKPLKVDSIVVHSPLIKQVLQKVFSGYPDLVVDLEELVFEAPFAPFFFRWSAFQEAVKNEKDEMAKSHLELLQTALSKELEQPIQRQADLLRHKAIDFELLWTLFVPGTLMYSHDNGHDRLYETGDSEYWTDISGQKFTVRCDMIDWDGEKFGKVTMSETLNKFKGTRKITSLPSYPLKFHQNAEEMKKKCIERGRRFQELTGVCCKDYRGTAIEYTKYGYQTVTTKRHLEGRLMLDEELFAKFNPDETQSVRDLGEDAEEIKKSEVEAAARLTEKVADAKAALKKAEEEEQKRKKEEEEKKRKEEDEENKKKEGDDKEDDKEKTEDSKQEEKAEVSKANHEDKETANQADKVDTDSKLETKDQTEKIQPATDTGKTTDEQGTFDSTIATTEVSQTSTQLDAKCTPETNTVETTPKTEIDASAKVTSDTTAATIPVSKSEDGKVDLTIEDKSTESPQTTTTNSEGVPTPPSEKADDEEEPKAYSSDEKQELKEDHLAICTSWLRGYSLSHQKWASFSIDHISDVVWNDDAFKELTLPAEYRELILATIQSQIRQNKWKQKMEKIDKDQKPLTTLSKSSGDMAVEDEDDDPAQFDDFIAQKGLGYIMLFSGNPGVGKTATAESIAELLHVPLCVISVGNLGTTAESVESGLQDVLELASKWNAVLLLDEADIFLEQRTRHDLHRNAVVSVFLRLLEYYQGVLCLTTNRSEEIDVAFHSRIHISLPFPDLTENNREQIWRHFTKITNKKHETNIAKRKALSGKTQNPATVAEAPPADEVVTGTNGSKTIDTPKPVQEDDNSQLIDLSTSDYRKLSQTPLNGRQIKNAFKTAVLLASYKKEKVQLKHVKTALKTIDGGGLGKREVGRMYY